MSSSRLTRWSGLAALLAVLFPVLGILEVPFPIVVFGDAVAWMGYALWSGRGQRALAPEVAM